MIRRFTSLLALAITLLLAAPAPAATNKGTTKKPVAAKPATPKKSAPVEVYAVEPGGAAPRVRASSAILLDANTGEILHEINADQSRAVASTQKLLTGLIVAEAGDLDREVRVQASDTWAEPTVLGFRPGETYTRGDLLRVFLVHSMNDVARCLARDNAGSVETFADKMNAKARALGMTHSNFVNPNGLPAIGQYSTARDMAKVAMAAYRNRTLRNIVALKSVTWRYNDGRTRVFETTNRVLKNYALCNGMKTGYTEAAGHCLISSAVDGGREVIAVVLGDDKSIWTDSYKLLAWGLSS